MSNGMLLMANRRKVQYFLNENIYPTPTSRVSKREKASSAGREPTAKNEKRHQRTATLLIRRRGDFPVFSSVIFHYFTLPPDNVRIAWVFNVDQSWVISHQSSAISHQSSVISHRHQSSVINTVINTVKHQHYPRKEKNQGKPKGKGNLTLYQGRLFTAAVCTKSSFVSLCHLCHLCHRHPTIMCSVQRDFTEWKS